MFYSDIKTDVTKNRLQGKTLLIFTEIQIYGKYNGLDLRNSVKISVSFEQTTLLYTDRKKPGIFLRKSEGRQLIQVSWPLDKNVKYADI